MINLIIILSIKSIIINIIIMNLIIIIVYIIMNIEYFMY